MSLGDVASSFYRSGIMDIDSLNKMLNQLREMYDIIIDNQNTPIILTPALRESIIRLSQKVQEICYMTDREIARAGMTRAQINEIIANHDKGIDMPPKVRQLLSRASELKIDLDGCRNVLKESLNNQKKAANAKGKKRKDSFKKIGSKKGWLPM
jgi:hypothetical protein